jgi:cbb3-type cytochrome oxidase maturation protein
MTILFMLIPMAVVIMGTAVSLFLWALREGQFDDLESPAMQVVLDDDRAPPARGASPGGDSTHGE